MKNKPIVITLIICILIAAAGLTYEFSLPGSMPLFSDFEAKAGEEMPALNGAQAGGRKAASDEGAQSAGGALLAEMQSGSDTEAEKEMAYRLIAEKNKANNRTAMQNLFQNKDQITIDCLGDSITWGMYSTPELEEAIDSGEVYTGYDDGGQMFEDFNIYVSGAYQSEPSYPEVLERELNLRLSAEGRRGHVTTVNDGICGDWIMPRTHERMSCDPDVVVFLMSGNNFYMNVPLNGAFEANLDALLDHGKIVYLANYPLYPGGPLMQYFESANEVIAKMAEQYRLPLIDLYSMVKQAAEGTKAETETASAAGAGAGGCSWDELYSPDRTHLSVKGYELIGNMIADAIWADIK